jgi:hypothetical protein
MYGEPTEELILELNASFGWELARTLRREELVGWLAEKLNGWILHDFPTLLQFLYRVDISESKLRLLLQANPHTDAGKILAELVLERQWQKIQTRRQYKPGDAGSDEERW